MKENLINKAAINLDIDFNNKEDLLNDLSRLAVSIGAGTDYQDIQKALYEREKLLPTALGKGMAIPHCRSHAIQNSKVLFYRLLSPIKWDETEEVNLVFSILTTDNSDNTHLALLSKLARHLLKEDFLKMLKGSTDINEIYLEINKILEEE